METRLQAATKRSNGNYRPPIEPSPVAPEVAKAKPKKNRKPLPIISAEFHGITRGDPRIRPISAYYPGRALVSLLAQMILPPRRFLRLASWMLNLPARAFWFLKVITSGKVDDTLYRVRMQSCKTCESRHVVATDTRMGIKVTSYCEACNCPQWSMSQLKVKNKYTRWSCPLRRHPGPYPDDELRARIKVEGWVETFPRAQKGGCSGCGGR